MLSVRAPQVFDRDELGIDPGILRAFLDVPAYYHGSRSLRIDRRNERFVWFNQFRTSRLPAMHQIALHVDANAFMELVDSLKQIGCTGCWPKSTVAQWWDSTGSSLKSKSMLARASRALSWWGFPLQESREAGPLRSAAVVDGCPGESDG
ncbi:MAG: hypothetical protein R2839_10005 [Thermomicrobiales bacterium]